MFRVARRLEATRVQLLVAPATDSYGRFGCVIGAKHMPRAVDRNRLKRMLREALRARGSALSGLDVVVRLRAACVAAELPAVAAEASALLDRVGPGGTA
jgi:ribonuclease P protein component